MPVTARIPMERLAEYFESFTQGFLRDGSAKALDAEVLEPDLGDQYAAEGARLRGITYDATSGALEFDLDSGAPGERAGGGVDHRGRGRLSERDRNRAR